MFSLHETVGALAEDLGKAPNTCWEHNHCYYNLYFLISSYLSLMFTFWDEFSIFLAYTLNRFLKQHALGVDFFL